MADAIREMVEADVRIVGAKVYANGTALDSDDSSKPLKLPNFPDKSVHVTGTFGAAGSITIQGSNDSADPPTLWATLHKPDMTDLTITAAGCFQVLENTLWIRGLVTGGDGTTALTLRLLANTSARR